MGKNHKKYHLAVSFTRYPSLQTLSLPTPTPPTPNPAHPHPHHPLLNIFNNNFEIRLRKLEIEESRNYEVVGYKEIQDISLRLDRKKRMVESGTKGTKQTFYSRSSAIKTNQDYLTKDEVVRYFSPHCLTAAATSRSKEEPPRNSPHKENKHPNATNAVNSSMNRSRNGTDTNCSHKSSQFSLAKLKKKMEHYQCGWSKQIENKRKLVKRPHQQAVSVIESVEQFRTISEDRQKLTLQQKLRNMSPSMWEKILRSPTKTASPPLDNFPHASSSRQLKNVGRGKYEKELLWLEEKDKRGYFFKKDKGQGVAGKGQVVS